MNMKAFDRACIYILVWLGILLFCSILMTETSAIITIVATIICFILIVYENKISYYEEKAEYYKKLFLTQNKQYMDYVCSEPEPRDKARTIKYTEGKNQALTRQTFSDRM